jgi:hypothetical protein
MGHLVMGRLVMGHLVMGRLVMGRFESGTFCDGTFCMCILFTDDLILFKVSAYSYTDSKKANLFGKVWTAGSN